MTPAVLADLARKSGSMAPVIEAIMGLRKMTGRATYLGDELHVEFSATGQLSDYGVPGSPVWTEWVDVEIDRLEILGHDVDINALPAPVQEAIRALADDLEFEPDEYDGPDRREDD